MASNAGPMGQYEAAVWFKVCQHNGTPIGVHDEYVSVLKLEKSVVYRFEVGSRFMIFPISAPLGSSQLALPGGGSVPPTDWPDTFPYTVTFKLCVGWCVSKAAQTYMGVNWR